MASTQEYFPFSEQSNDEGDWRALIGALSESGIVDGLEVTGGSGMEVLLAPGRAFVEGFLYTLSGDPLALAVDAAHATLARKDAVILKADLTAKTVVPSVKAGTTAGGGTLPTLTNTSTVREIMLYPLTVPAAATNIITGNVGARSGLAPKRVKVYADSTTRPSPTDEDYAIGVDLSTKIIEFWNGSAWSNLAVPWAALTGAPATFAPAAHTLDSHTGELGIAKGGTGATTAAAARTALGVPAIVHTHAAADISDSTSAGRAVLTAASASAQRTALGAGAVGGAVFTAADWTAAREALGIYKGNGPGSPLTGTIRLRDI